MSEVEFYEAMAELVHEKNLDLYISKRDDIIGINAQPYAYGEGKTLAEAMRNFQSNRKKQEENFARKIK